MTDTPAQEVLDPVPEIHEGTLAKIDHRANVTDCYEVPNELRSPAQRAFAIGKLAGAILDAQRGVGDDRTSHALAQATGLSRKAVEYLRNQPDMVAEIIHLARSRATENLQPLLDAIHDNAMKPGRDGQRDRELEADILGLTGRSRGVLSASGGPTVAITIRRTNDWATAKKGSTVTEEEIAIDVDPGGA
jgi:hypothetical protein